jgi:hypothetical protein
MRSYLLTLAFTATVAAHGHVLGITADQKYYQGYTPNFQYMKPRPKVPAWTAGGYGQGGIFPDKYNAVSSTSQISKEIWLHPRSSVGKEADSHIILGKYNLP